MYSMSYSILVTQEKANLFYCQKNNNKCSWKFLDKQTLFFKVFDQIQQMKIWHDSWSKFYTLLHTNLEVLEKILESPLDSKEIKLGNPKGTQFCIFTERTDAEAKAPILWPPDAKI